jgi:hypothetical protein
VDARGSLFDLSPQSSSGHDSGGKRRPSNVVSPQSTLSSSITCRGAPLAHNPVRAVLTGHPQQRIDRREYEGRPQNHAAAAPHLVEVELLPEDVGRLPRECGPSERTRFRLIAPHIPRLMSLAPHSRETIVRVPGTPFRRATPSNLSFERPRRSCCLNAQVVLHTATTARITVGVGEVRPRRKGSGRGQWPKQRRASPTRSSFPTRRAVRACPRTCHTWVVALVVALSLRS